jgi:hypothetical protein
MGLHPYCHFHQIRLQNVNYKKYIIKTGDDSGLQVGDLDLWRAADSWSAMASALTTEVLLIFVFCPVDTRGFLPKGKKP